jgi:hypothetical protein
MKNLIFTCMLLSLIGYGCSHYYYVPNIQNVPLFREKNEYRISGIYAEGDKSSSIEVQSAYSLTRNIGISANFLTAWGGEPPDKSYGKGYYFDGALGYFKPLGKYSIFEIYGGIGGCGQHHQYVSQLYNQSSGIYYQSLGTSDLSFVRSFVQPSFGVTFTYLDAAFSARISRLSFTNIDNHIYGNQDLSDELYNLSGKSHFFLEPAITLRAGWDVVKLQFQASYSKYLNKPEAYFGEEYHIGFGIILSLPAKNKKSAQVKSRFQKMEPKI